MLAPAILFLALLAQEPKSLEIGKPIEGIIGVDSPAVQTPTLDASYSNAPTVGNAYSVRVPKSGAYTIELRSHDFDTYLVITDSNSTLLAEDDDGLLNTHARVTIELEAEIKYVVQACAILGKRGKFQLKLVEGSPPPSAPEDKWLAEEKDLKARLSHIESTHGKETVEYAESQYLLGLHYYNARLYKKVQVEWGSSLATYERVLGPKHPQTTTILNNLAVLFESQGNYEEARPLFERSLAIREEVLGPDHPETAAILNNLAALLQGQGNYEEALPLYERSLAIREKVLGPEHPQTATSLNNLAALLGDQGNYEEARSLYERSLALREKVLGPEHPQTATSLNHLAALLQGQGNYEEARSLYKRSLAIREKVLGPEHPDTATSLNNLAMLLQGQGNHEEARPLFERSLAIREKVLGPEHPDTANSLNNLALLLKSQGNYEEARSLYERSLALREKVLGPEHPQTATSLNNLAALLGGQGNYEGARPLFERSLAIWEKVLGPEHPLTATSLNLLARLLEAQGNYVGAIPLRRQALSGSLSHLDQELPSMSEAGRLRLLEISANPETLLNILLNVPKADLGKAYSLFQRWKGKATRLQSASVRLGSIHDVPGIREKKGKIQVLAKKLSGLILVPLANQADDHAEQIDSLRQERLRLERELNRELGLDIILATPSSKEVQAGLPPDAVLLDFFAGEDVYAWVMKPTGEPKLISLGERAALREAQNAFLGATAVRGGRKLSTSENDPAANYLAMLWKPLQEAMGDSKTVFVSPDGFLCELPFGILQEEDESYLLERYRFVYLSDPTNLARSEGPSKVDEGSLFAVGGVNYFRRDAVGDSVSSRLTTRSRVGESWSSLPATRDEMQSLRDLHDFSLEWESPMTVVEGKAATEERIRAELPGKRYVHIATHGYFEPDHLPSLLLDAEEKQSKAQLGEQIQAVGLLPGLLSGLVFAGVNGEPDPTRDDGYLSAEEIQHLDLSACDLVVLSACETALGSARAGEGLMSLRRSFSVAGADTVISSLWKVDDRATAQLMKDFYTNLWEKNMSRGEALHEAKVRMLRRNRIDNGGDAMPSTWGAFVLSGEWN